MCSVYNTQDHPTLTLSLSLGHSLFHTHSLTLSLLAVSFRSLAGVSMGMWRNLDEVRGVPLLHDVHRGERSGTISQKVGDRKEPEPPPDKS